MNNTNTSTDADGTTAGANPILENENNMDDVVEDDDDPLNSTSHSTIQVTGLSPLRSSKKMRLSTTKDSVSVAPLTTKSTNGDKGKNSSI